VLGAGVTSTLVEEGGELMEYQEIPPWKVLWNMLRYNDPMGRMSPVGDEAVAAPVSAIGSIKQMCDRCHVATAAWEVRTENGSVFLCSHHYNVHAAHIAKNHNKRELG
jgi:hypothetical protein